MSVKKEKSCTGCGQCCKCLVFAVPDTPDVREFYLVRGLKLFSKNKYLEVVVPHVCPNLKDNLCELHESKKPWACKIFPVEPQPHLLPDCGFND